ncbi:MAG TPA: HEPN domain-containing protein [Azospirillum sp.]|nr:HEPN domain-containing protein [Azospirillum sp.]
MTSISTKLLATAYHHLNEAEKVATEAPSAAVHSAYYAMFHAARAVLQQTHGTASLKHGTVHKGFEALVANGSPDAQIQAHGLRAVYQARLETDYTMEPATPEIAAALVPLAVDFVAWCARRLGAEPPPNADP